MSNSTETQLMLIRIENDFPNISARVKRTLSQIYQSQVVMLDKHQQEKVELSKLFDQLIKDLNHDLYSTEYSIHDLQIKAIYDQTKKSLDAFRENWSKSSFNTEEFNKSFTELIGCIISSFDIMSIVFQHVSIKVNKLAEKIETIREENNLMQEKIDTMEKNELSRAKKEKKQEKQILIRDLFTKVRERLSEEIRKQRLAKNQIQILYDKNTDRMKLSNDHPLLNRILNDVSHEFGIDVDTMIRYLKENKQTNDTFHLDMEIKKYAAARVLTKIYNLNEFLNEHDMHPMDTENFLSLQPVFSQVCRIINKDQ